MFQHPDILSPIYGVQNDLSLLQLKTPLKFGLTINKIDLDTDIRKNYTGEVCTISGWGNTNGSGTNYPDRLQVVSMHVVPIDYCKTSYPGIYSFPKNTICLQDGKKDSCNKDSGGPMVCSKKLVGVLSFGVESCDGRSPSVHTRVSAYTDWIKKEMKNKRKNKKNDKKDKKSKNNKNNNNEKKSKKDKKKKQKEEK
ncbi:Hypothetical predicted protein [Mytilus galloprovincialis]|uniref:Peptidase S1 domain-containing protein n=1 Tax=Mytilus galloprovincialis TaxID=29158 RepID=A0A8B6D4R5_MYTGA|nr:Hypothetical predicted protein [Mytilus galloprovincialis]